MTAVPPAAADPAQLCAFAARVRRLHARRAIGEAALRVLLALGAPLLLLAWLWPAGRLPLAAGLAGAVLLAAAAALWRALWLPEAALWRQLGGPAGAAALGDELLTWLELHRRRAADQPMAQWLGRDLSGQLPALPPAGLAAVGRRGLGRLVDLLPLVLLLLACWWLGEWLRPPVPGPRAVPPPAGTPPPAGGSGQGPGPASSAAGAPSPTPPSPAPAANHREPPPEPPPAEAPPPPEPAPLLDLPEQQRLVVPEFLGDGPTRRARVRTAEAPGEAAGPAAAPPPSGAAGNTEPPAVPPPAQETFERAAEAALRARHVPPAERPMVRRFFERLRGAGQ